MHEITRQASQMQVHEAVKEIEVQKQKEEEESKKKADNEKELQLCFATNKEIQLIDEMAVERDDAIRSALVEEVIKETNDSGTPLPPSVIRLLEHLKGMEQNNQTNFSFSYLHKKCPFFFCRIAVYFAPKSKAMQ